MIEITVYNNKCLFRNLKTKDLEFIDKKLKFWKKNFNPDPYGNAFDAISIFNKKDYSMPTGYLEYLKEKLTKEDIKFKERNKRFLPMSSQGFDKLTNLPYSEKLRL